jgi:hypothetical protein
VFAFVRSRRAAIEAELAPQRPKVERFFPDALHGTPSPRSGLAAS